MKTKIIKIFTIISLIYLTLIPVSVFADDSCSEKVCNGNYPDAVKSACNCSSAPETPEASDVVRNIINTIIGMLGIVAVVFIFIGGISYMTSSGDAGKVKKAKDTILYACIGLAVCALSFAIANFAIDAINKSTDNTTTPRSTTP